MPPIPDSPFDQFREGKPVKIKTIFHSVDVEIDDGSGGKFSATYEIKELVNKLTEFLKSSFPAYSKRQIEELANE
jgi:hypothetical protein